MRAAMIGPLVMKYFTKQGDEECYRTYRKIKYQVFVTELGWSSLEAPSGEGVAQADPFDEEGRFLLAMTQEGLPIGTVRAVHLKKAFPHRDLFEHHLCHTGLSESYDSLCTFNALAVLPEYRRKKYRVVDEGWMGTVGCLLMIGIIHHMEKENVKVAIVTTDGIVPTRLSHSLGFHVIDSPTIAELRPEPLVNMGMVFGSEAHIRAQKECGMKLGMQNLLEGESLRLLCYFESCEKHALGSDRLEVLFQSKQKPDRGFQGGIRKQ